ncbi:hypothetical protein FSP39_004253 [Pinctada imbricata]|uniref:CRAL-TRIO domain-containing protein n=1 Tax=Pinctada imbricata TaxID=66713 RepID=A0AA89BLH4_PINIB|nr:hypothetical protein FSP39_004253 [Pinctada imbricata]
MTMEDKIRILRERMESQPPIEGEEGFATSDETIIRYLKSRDWNLAEAEKTLLGTLEYRRKVRPREIDCKYCHDRHGYHSMRQVGFDESKRPVIYANFAQASIHRNTVEDSVTHVTYLFENAKFTMAPGVTTWVIVIDCTGINLPSCNPKLGYEVTQVMANHYPERLGMVICLNHNPMFQAVWNAVKVFLHKNTVAKMKLVRTKTKYIPLFQKYFPDELTDWLIEEIKRNKQTPLPASQCAFWEKPEIESDHDPRGCPSYVKNFVETYARSDSKNVHKPHPNIINALKGSIKTNTHVSEVIHKESKSHVKEVGGANGAENSDHSEEEPEIDSSDSVEIGKEYQIPTDAKRISAAS